MGRVTRWIAVGAVAASVAGLLAASAVHAEGGRHGPPPIERVLERHADELGLDEALRVRIREIARAGDEASAAQREKLHALRDEMHAMLAADAPDEDAVLAKADEIGALKTALKKERLRTMLAIRALLSPEQRRELVRIHDEMRAQRKERRRERHADDRSDLD